MAEAFLTNEQIGLEFLPFGFAIAALAGVAQERVLNYRTPEEVIAWASQIDGR